MHALGQEQLEPVRTPDPLKELGKTDELRLVYFLPSDREPRDKYEERITVLATFVADTYRRSLESAESTVLSSAIGYRLPEPTRLADRRVARAKKELG